MVLVLLASNLVLMLFISFLSWCVKWVFFDIYVYCVTNAGTHLIHLNGVASAAFSLQTALWKNLV